MRAEISFFFRTRSDLLQPGLNSLSALSALVPFGFKHISMMFRNKQAVEQPRLYPLFVMITVLKDAFTAVSAVTVGKINSEDIFKYLLYYNVIRDKLNGTSAQKT